ncbi:MAG: carboxypeptidase-like regulatory domain-containing protein, partial [Longimicrobiales bacterium]
MPALPSQVVRRLLTFAALLLVVIGTRPVAAQTDVIRGKVTSSDGLPLPNVRVTATSIPGNVTRSAQTNAQGNFQLPFPNGTGDYIMGYAIFGYAFRQFQVKRLVDEEVLIADARLAPMQLDTLVVTAQQQQRVNRNAGTPDVSGTEQVIMNTNVALELMGDIAAMAASLPGVLLLPGLDGAPDAFSVLGLDGAQNSTTLNGMQMGGNGLPRDAAISTSLTTSSYDVSRGGFSGGNFNVRSRPGSNFRTRGASLQMTTPQVQWADRAAQAAGNDYTNFSLSGVASGPLKPNKAFYNISAQFDRNARDNLSLLSVSELGLQTAGVAMDSVSRFLGLLNGYGIPGFVGRSRPNRYNDSGRLFGSIDFSPPGSTSGQSIGITFNGNWSREVPTSGGLLALESAGGNRTRWSGGLQARHSGYLGLILTESSAGVNVSHNSGNAFLDLPAGRVRVVSGNGVQSLTFGGNQGLDNSSSSTNITFQNNLSWFDNANKHRLKFTTEVQY